ncbi:hypothetical protein II906_02065 [bacterium]|nr:hypothetical protein [bacterium]
MRLNSITTNHHIKGRAIEHSPHLLMERENRENCAKFNNEQINTTIMNNSDGRVSFKGVEAVKAPLFHKIAKFTNASPLIAEALFALVITCGLRPITIMATAKTDEDKEKCKYQAVKSISSGVVGLGFTAFVGTWIKNAKGAVYNSKGFKLPDETKAQAREAIAKGREALFKILEEADRTGNNSPIIAQIRKLVEKKEIYNLEIFKYFGHKGMVSQKAFIKGIRENFKDEAEVIIKGLEAQKVDNNYISVAQKTIEKLWQPISMPVRAAITIALVPIILNGIKKLTEKKAEQKQLQNMQNQTMGNQYSGTQYNIDKELFADFLGGSKNENK